MTTEKEKQLEKELTQSKEKEEKAKKDRLDLYKLLEDVCIGIERHDPTSLDRLKSIIRGYLEEHRQEIEASA